MTTETNPRRAAYEQWVHLHAPELYRFAYRLTGRHAAAEDLLQETFTEAWRSIDKQREPEKARAWLFQILRFQHMRIIRREVAAGKLVRFSGAAEGSQTDPSAAPGSAMADRETLDAALSVLPPDIRKTFLMVFLENLTCRQTAAELHIPLGTVLSRLDSARKTLRAAINRDESPKTAQSPLPRKAVQSQ